MRGKLLSRGKDQRDDYILYYKPNMPLAGGRKGYWRFHEVAILDRSAVGPGFLLAFNDNPYEYRGSGAGNVLMVGQSLVVLFGEVSKLKSSVRLPLMNARHCRIIKTCSNLHHQNLRARRSQAYVGSGPPENGGGDRCRSRQSAFAPGNGRDSQVALDRIGTGKARWNPDDLLPSRRTGDNLHADSLCEGRP